MTDSNPYSPPADLAGRGPSAPVPQAGGPTPTAVEHLRRTRPWTLFLAILGFIGGGVMALATLIMLIGAAAGGGEPFGNDDAAVVLLIGAFYAVATALYILVSVMLFRYARAIGLLLQFNRNEELEEALDAQRRFWKTAGVVTLVGMALAVLAMVAGIAIAVVGFSGLW